MELLKTALSIALVSNAIAVSPGDSTSASQAGVFATLALPGTLADCRRLLKPHSRSLLDCQMSWMQLKQLNNDPSFIRINQYDEVRGCEISAWCDQLLVNESDPLTALFPASLGQPRLVLFAVKSGSQVKVLDSFLTPIGCNQSLLVSPAVGPPPIHFWRSCWLDRLPDLMRLLSGKTLSVEILKDGATVLKISFDASFAGLNVTNWFGKDRLVGSEPDLAMAGRTFNYFSIIGDDRLSTMTRRFFVNMVYTECPGDIGIMAVTDQIDPCPWAQIGSSSTALPKILYNLKSGVWNGNSVLADFMLVTVK